MSALLRFDAHCHIFSLEYALKEVKNMLHDMLRGTYPWKEPQKLMLKERDGGRFSDLKKLLRWLYELIHAAGTNELENLNFMQRQAQKVFPSDSLSIIPLMMDIFYILAYGLDKDEEAPLKSKAREAEVNPEEFQQYWNEVLDDFTDYLKSTKKTTKSQFALEDDIRLETTLILVEQERNVNDLLTVRTKVHKLAEGIDYYHTQGFSHHFNKLMELEKTRNSELYPFIAVDPRRPGMIEAVLSGIFFTGSPRFYGVKLYPRLGYHPQCKPLWPLYEFCSKNGIPITYHCGMSGFPPGTNWKWASFGDPANFEPIVRTFPKLRINFAHMGSSDPSHQWEKTVLRLINDPDINNVYTDLSCYTNPKELQPMKDYWDNNPRLWTKLMYGSDFDMIYLTNTRISLEQYIQNFTTVFGNNLNQMMVENPKRFLEGK